MSKDPRWSAGDESTQTQTGSQPSLKPQSRQLSIDDIFQPTAVASRGGVATSKVKDVFEAIASEFASKTTDNRNVYVCIADEAPLRVPAVILYSITQEGIYSVPLILEACGERLEPRTVNSATHGRPIQIDMPTSRYYVGTMEAICRARVLSDAISRNLVKGSVVVQPLSYAVVKRHIKLEDDSSIKLALSPFFDSAVAAIAAKCNASMNMPTSRLTSEMLANNNAWQLVARHTITPGASKPDIFGSECAQDFKIEMVARSANRNTDDLHKEGREIVISQLTGYVDFAYHAPDTIQRQQAAAQKAANSPYNAVNIPAYDPYIVITSATPLGASTILGDNIMTQAFALASANGIAQGQRWATVFGRTGVDGAKKASIGAFALEHDPSFIVQDNPQILPVSAGFEPVMGGNTITPLEVINKFCHNTMIVAMDIEEGGPMQWVQSIFAQAKPGTQQEALIIKELDSFSNGAFSKIWDRRQSIVAYEPVIIQGGYYTSSDGHKQDIRKLDYLAALTYSNGDLSIMQPYAEGFQPGHSSAETLHAKREIIKSAFPNVEFTGIHIRSFFNSAFIGALEQMFAAVNLRIQLEGISDIINNIGRTSAFDGSFNNTIVGHGAFHQNYGLSQNSTPINMGFGGVQFFRN